MKKVYIFLLSIAITTIQAQNIEVVSNVINFPDATEISSSTGTIEIYNPGIFPLTIVDVDLFDIYDHQPFSLTDTSFNLFPQDTHTVTVTFLPEHNLMHNMALVIKTNSGFGHKAVTLTGQGKFSNSYYNTTENKSEEALKTALKAKLAAGYNSLGYTTARDNMYGSIDNSGGVVTCVYTARTATFNTRAGANSNSFNTEHTYPQGKFNSAEPMRSDIHHLFPTDVSANSQRGNDPFGMVTGTPSWQNGGSKSGGGKFEPRDPHKGTAARAMMYFVIRYQDYQNFFVSQEAILRNWHDQYPPSSADIARNNAISQLQTSRNPFVDYPQFEERINSFVSTSVAPAIRGVYFSDDTINLRPAAGRYEFEFVVYNKGNQTINLNNFSFTDTTLKIVPVTPVNFPVQPGEARTLKVSYNSSVNYVADFEFDTDVPGSLRKTIPVRSGAKIGVREWEQITEIDIYPNPADEVLYIDYPSSEPETVEMYNLAGVKLQLPVSKQIDVSSLPAGLYIVKIKMLDGTYATEKVILN